MAITQDRMLSLIAEYEGHINSEENVRKFFHHFLLAKVDLGQIPREVLEEYDFRITNFPAFTKERFAVEKYHFQRNTKSNTRRAERARTKRREDGVPERTQMPLPVPVMSGLFSIKPEHQFEEDESKLTTEEKEQMAMMREFQREHPHGTPQPTVLREKPWDPLHVPELDLDNE